MLESANRVLKDHYGRKAHNIKEVISKLKDFFRGLSSKEKQHSLKIMIMTIKLKKKLKILLQKMNF